MKSKGIFGDGRKIVDRNILSGYDVFTTFLTNPTHFHAMV
jgi:hypothetical protein